MTDDDAQRSDGEALMDFDGVTDAQIERHIVMLDGSSKRDSPEAIKAFLASPDGMQGGPEKVAERRRMFDRVRDWAQGERAECHAELARRRAAASASKGAPGLYFGPWRGF